MKVELFSEFIQHIGAQKYVTHAFSFAMYIFEERKLIIHFIDINTYKKQNLPDSFFSKLSSKTNIIHHHVIHVWEDHWIHKTGLIKFRIQSIIGLAKKIHARQTDVIRIDKQQSQGFLNQHHLQGATSAYYKFGLMHKSEMVAVATFSKARTMYDGPVYYRSYELERFASTSGINIVGGLSKLIQHFIKTNHVKHLMTYADRDWSTGEGYLKTGFKLIEETPPQVLYIDELSYVRFSDKQITNIEHKIKIHNAGSLKFVWDNR
jgi:hypothetical protein